VHHALFSLRQIHFQYNDKELEKISLFARTLRPLLREQAADEDVIDLSNVAMSHYRLSKIR
jgi:type I restriction enzyme R subunit